LSLKKKLLNLATHVVSVVGNYAGNWTIPLIRIAAAGAMRRTVIASKMMAIEKQVFSPAQGGMPNLRRK